MNKSRPRRKVEMTGQLLTKAAHIAANEARNRPGANPKYVEALEMIAAILGGIEWPRGRHLTSGWIFTAIPGPDTKTTELHNALGNTRAGVDHERDFGPRSRVDDWPIVDVLGHLASATEHLLQHHNCDEHGHETWKYAAEAAWKHVALLNKPAATPTPVERLRSAPEGEMPELVKCEVADCNEPQRCFHYCQEHHRTICLATPSPSLAAREAAEDRARDLPVTVAHYQTAIRIVELLDGWREQGSWISQWDSKEEMTTEVAAIISRHCSPVTATSVVNLEAWTTIDKWLRENPEATPAQCLAELVRRIKVETAAVPAAGGDEDRQELQKLRQAIGWICDACDAAYIEDPNNERIHELFNIAAKAAGLTRRLPDEHGRFDETMID